MNLLGSNRGEYCRVKLFSLLCSPLSARGRREGLAMRCIQLFPPASPGFLHGTLTKSLARAGEPCLPMWGVRFQEREGQNLERVH